MVNAKIFSILDGNALSTLEQKNLLEAEYKTYCKFLVVKVVECYASYDRFDGHVFVSQLRSNSIVSACFNITRNWKIRSRF